MTRPDERRGPWTQTFTGRAFYPFDPRPEDVDIVDVCGNRDWSDDATIRAWLEWLHSEGMARNVVPVLIHGGAPGADRFADNIAHKLGWNVLVFEADWRRGPKAGPERNERMLSAKPTMGLAFGRLRKESNDSRWTGTGDMVCRLAAAGVLTHVIGRPGVMP